MANRPKEPYAVEPRKLPSGRWKGRVVRYDAETGKRRELTQTHSALSVVTPPLYCPQISFDGLVFQCRAFS